MKTKQDVIDIIKRIVKRGSRYDADIADFLYIAVRDLERNTDFEHMRRTVTVAVPGTGAGIKLPYPVYAIHVALAQGGGDSLTHQNSFLEDPLNIKRFIQVAIATSSNVNKLTTPLKYSEYHPFALGASSAKDVQFFPLKQVTFENIGPIAGRDAPIPELQDGSKAPHQMPTKFCLTKHPHLGVFEATRYDDLFGYGRVNTLYPYQADMSYMLFNGPLFDGIDINMYLYITYLRFTPDDGTTQTFDTVKNNSIWETAPPPNGYQEVFAVYEHALDFLIAKTMVSLCPIIGKLSEIPYWKDQEATARRTLNIAQEEIDYSSEGPMEMEYP